MLNNRFDYEDEKTEMIWRTFIKIILIPVVIGIIIAIITIIEKS